VRTIAPVALRRTTRGVIPSGLVLTVSEIDRAPCTAEARDFLVAGHPTSATDTAERTTYESPGQPAPS